jgi:hypothetical protein
LPLRSRHPEEFLYPERFSALVRDDDGKAGDDGME